MTDSTDAILKEVSSKLGDLTEAYVRLEVTTRTETQGLREDLADMRSLLRDVTRTQTDHGERLTAGETRISALQESRVGLAETNARVSVLEERVKNNAPVRAPWTAIASSVVAMIALAWSLFGK